MTNFFIITTADLFSLAYRCKQAWNKPSCISKINVLFDRSRPIFSWTNKGSQLAHRDFTVSTWPGWWLLVNRSDGQVQDSRNIQTDSKASFARTRVADFRAFQILEQFRRVRILFLAINQPMRSLTWISAGNRLAWVLLCHATFRTTSHRHFLGFLSFEIKYVHLNNCFHVVLLLLPFNCVAESTVERSNL